MGSKKNTGKDDLHELSEDFHACKENVENQLSEGNDRMTALEDSLKTIEVKLDTILTLFNNFEGFFKVMGWIGKGAVWSAKIGAVFIALWLFLKDHIK